MAYKFWISKLTCSEDSSTMAMVFLLVIINIFNHFPMSHINMCMNLNHISKCIITLVTFKRSIGMNRPEMFSSINKTCFSKGSFIYYVSTFFINRNIFTNFLRIFLYVLKISNYSIKILSKCNVEIEILLFWQVFLKSSGGKLSFVL